MEWAYRKTGPCDFCPDGDAALKTPKVSPPLRYVVPPLFCKRCRTRFEHAARNATDLQLVLNNFERQSF